MLGKNSKIALVCNSFRIDGGTGLYTVLLTRALLELGFRPEVVGKKFDQQLPEYAEIIPHQISTKLVPQKLVDYYYDLRLKQYCKQHVPDLLISCSRNSSSDIAVCGGTHLGYLHAMRHTPTFWDNRQVKLETQYYSHSRLIVAHSEKLRKELINLYGVPESKIMVAYPPLFSLQKFSTIPEEERKQLRQTLGFPADRTVFLLVCAGNPFMKGLDLIADYFSKSNLPILLVVAGRPFNGSYRNVRYIGFRSDMEKIYQAVDYTVVSSRYEAFGQIGPESVACGTPVIFARGAGSAEVIADEAKIEFDWSIEGSVHKAMQLAIERRRQGLNQNISRNMISSKLSSPVNHARDILKRWETIALSDVSI